MKKILIIDDDQGARKSLEIAIKKTLADFDLRIDVGDGCTVPTVNEIDLVIIDIGQFSEKRWLADKLDEIGIPLILTSGIKGHGRIAEELEAEFVWKPFDLETLACAILGLIDPSPRPHSISFAA